MRETSLTNEHNFSPYWLTGRKTRSYLLTLRSAVLHRRAPKTKVSEDAAQEGWVQVGGGSGREGVGVGGSAGEEKSVGSKQEVL